MPVSRDNTFLSRFFGQVGVVLFEEGVVPVAILEIGGRVGVVLVKEGVVAVATRVICGKVHNVLVYMQRPGSGRGGAPIQKSSEMPTSFVKFTLIHQ